MVQPPFFMAIAKRLSYTLLISTSAFLVFSVVAFSGLFPWIEAQLYSPRVVASFQNRLTIAAERTEQWKADMVRRIDALLEDSTFAGVFSPTSSQTVLQARYQSAKLLLLGLKGGGAFRILSRDRTQIHFSTEDTDVRAKGDFALTYRTVADAGVLPSLMDSEIDGGVVKVLDDPQAKLLFFLRPWIDGQGAIKGHALLSVSIEDLKLNLLETVDLGTTFRALGGETYLFSLLGTPIDEALLTRIAELQAQGVRPPVQRLASADGLVTVALVRSGAFLVLVPTQALELSSTLKGLVLLSFFSIIFLITFLVANVRGEPLSVLTRKVKRFQLQVVKQYLDLKEQDRVQSLRDELSRHSDEIRADIRRSLGRVRRRDREWVDRYIDTSWQEVMDLLRGPSPPTDASPGADWKRLETLLQQALTQGRFVVSGPSSAAGVGEGAVRASGPATPAPPRVRDDSEVEELQELEEVSDLEEADEAKEVHDLEEVDDVEEVEELEEVGELEEVADAEPLEELPPEDETSSAGASVPGSATLDQGREQAVQLNSARSLETIQEQSQEWEDLEELEEVEGEDSHSEEMGNLEELAPGNGPKPVDPFRLQRGPEGTVTDLPLDEDPEDLEELAELEEVPDDSAPPARHRDSSYPLDQLDQIWGSGHNEVFDQDDEVVSLSDTLFVDTSAARDDFGLLVNEVLSGTDTGGFVPLEEDLVPEMRSREWRWTGAGFDWDRFALGTDEVNLFRAMSDIVSELDAFTAVILVQKNGGWVAQSSVGFSDLGKPMLNFPPDSPMNQELLSRRALHVLEGGASHPILRASFHPKDMKFLQAVACIPLLFRHEPSWLLLGFRRHPEDLVTLLAPRRFS